VTKTCAHTKNRLTVTVYNKNVHVLSWNVDMYFLISWIISCYYDILLFCISVTLYLFAGGYKCRLTTFPTRFAHVVSIFWYCHWCALMQLWCHEQINKCHVISTRAVRRIRCHTDRSTNEYFVVLDREIRATMNLVSAVLFMSVFASSPSTSHGWLLCCYIDFPQFSLYIVTLSLPWFIVARM